jgi:hypothetical protein
MTKSSGARPGAFPLEEQLSESDMRLLVEGVPGRRQYCPVGHQLRGRLARCFQGDRVVMN